MKIKITKRKEYLRIEKILKTEFIIRTLIFFLVVFIFFYNFIYKVWNINNRNVDILFSYYIFILSKIYTKM